MEDLSSIIEGDNLLDVKVEFSVISKIVSLLNTHLKSQGRRIDYLEKFVLTLLPKDVFDKELGIVKRTLKDHEKNIKDNEVAISFHKSIYEQDKVALHASFDDKMSECMVNLDMQVKQATDSFKGLEDKFAKLEQDLENNRIPDDVLNQGKITQTNTKNISSLNNKVERLYEMINEMGRKHRSDSTQREAAVSEKIVFLENSLGELVEKTDNIIEEMAKNKNTRSKQSDDDEELRIDLTERDSHKYDEKKDSASVNSNNSNDIVMAQLIFDRQEIENLKSHNADFENVINELKDNLSKCMKRLKLNETINNSHQFKLKQRTIPEEPHIPTIFSSQSLMTTQSIESYNYMADRNEIKEEIISTLSSKFKQEFNIDSFNKLAGDLKKMQDQCLIGLDRVVDRDFAERLFEKFRFIVSGINDKVAKLHETISGFATVKDLQDLAFIVKDIKNSGHSAASKNGPGCLFCGRPRSVIGQIKKSSIQKIGIAPLGQVISDNNIIYANGAAFHAGEISMNTLPNLLSEA